MKLRFAFRISSLVRCGGTRAAAARRSSPSADTTRVGCQKTGQPRNLKDLKTLECCYIIRRIGTIVLAKTTLRVYDDSVRGRYHAFNSTNCLRDFSHRVGGSAQHDDKLLTRLFSACRGLCPARRVSSKSLSAEAQRRV